MEIKKTTLIKIGCLLVAGFCIIESLSQLATVGGLG